MGGNGWTNYLIIYLGILMLKFKILPRELCIYLKMLFFSSYQRVWCASGCALNLSLAFEATCYFNLIMDGVNGGSRFEPIIIQPGETKDLSFLSLKDEAWEDRILNSILTIHTNISNIHVPLLCFHGLIDTVSIIYRCILKNVTSQMFFKNTFYAHVF